MKKEGEEQRKGVIEREKERERERKRAKVFRKILYIHRKIRCIAIW